jgi:CheY-like chemotaxis protein
MPSLWTAREFAAVAAPVSVLVVDDDENIAYALEAVLALEGFEAKAVDCVTCLSLMDAIVPHVIVLDLEMPIIDGFAVARALRQRTQLATTVVIAHTSLDEIDVVVDGTAAGIDAYCRKGSPATVLLNLIRRLAPLVQTQ